MYQREGDEVSHGVRTAPDAARPRLPVLKGLLPVRRQALPADLLAGVTLAALGVPEVLGYAKLAGMPVVTGLYTLVAPMIVFAVLGSSRHLVVGADSATAVIMATGVTALAAAGSPQYVALAGLVALLAGLILLLARLLRLGFLSNFLSRTVLIGFLTGVGIQIAVGQLAEMLGVSAHGSGTVGKAVATAGAAGRASLATVLVSLAVLVVVVGMRRLTRRVPGALIAVVAAIVVSRLAHLDRFGVALLGPVPSGLPHPQLPSLSLSAAIALLGSVVSIVVVVLAQSSVTSRAYAERYNEALSEDDDLVGLAGANLAAALTGTFVVNGSPTKTQMVNSAGGRSQLAQLTTAGVVVVILLLLTGELAYLPLAVLASVVFLIGVELVDVRAMARLYRERREEFLVALLTAVAVVVLGVEQGIILAIVLSLVVHLRHSYAPRNTILVPLPLGGWRSDPVRPGVRSKGSVVVYRFGASLYYANVHSLLDDVAALLNDGAALTVFCLDFAAIQDIDVTAAAALGRVLTELADRDVRFYASQMPLEVVTGLDRYGLLATIGQSHLLDSPSQALATPTRSS